MHMHQRIPLQVLATLLTTLLLVGCTSEIPLLIRQGPSDSPTPTAAGDRLDDYLGQQVRWGGTIIETGNRQDATRLTVLARPLYRDGEPRLSDDSLGRFVAIVPEFLDPKVYAADRRVTVTGTLTHTETGKVGEHPYRYPVIEAQAWYLWPRETEVPYYYDDPWSYDPWWYDPWYSHGYPYAFPYRYWP